MRPWEKGKIMMKIVSLFGSPRMKGNTSKVLSWVEEELRNRGHEVQRINVTEHEINGCLECYACQEESGEPGCPQPDDAVAILNRLIAADAIVYASPLFSWSWTAQMKALIDRHFCLVTDIDTEHPRSLLDGKRLALVATAQGPVEGNLDLLVQQFNGLAQYCKAEVAEHLVVPWCTTPDAISDDIRKQATAMAMGFLR